MVGLRQRPAGPIVVRGTIGGQYTGDQRRVRPPPTVVVTHRARSTDRAYAYRNIDRHRPANSQGQQQVRAGALPSIEFSDEPSSDRSMARILFTASSAATL